MDGVTRYGVNAAMAAINRGDFTVFWKIIRDVNAKQPAQRAAGMMALRGALTFFSDYAIGATRHRVRFSKAQPPTRDEIDYALTVGGDRLSKTTQLLLGIVSGVRAGRPDLRISVRDESAQPPAAQPLSVAIVSLPGRKTTSEIARNEAGDIVSTMQVEKDF